MKIRALKTTRMAYDNEPAKPQVQLVKGREYTQGIGRGKIHPKIVKRALEIGVVEEVGLMDTIKKVVTPNETKKPGRPSKVG